MKHDDIRLHSISAALALAAALLAAPAAMAQDKPATAASAKADVVQDAKAPAVPAAVVQKPVAVPADGPEAEAYRKRLMELRGPRDKGMAEIQAVTEKIAARKKALFAENEEAGKLAAEIEAMKKEVEAKDAALAKILAEDEALKALNQELVAAHESVRLSQRGVQDEIARRHREHRIEIEKKMREAEAAKAKAEEAEAAQAAAEDKTGPEASK